MPKCTDGRGGFGRIGRRLIEADFDGGDINSDGGLLLLRRADERAEAAAAFLAVTGNRPFSGQHRGWGAARRCDRTARPGGSATLRSSEAR